VKRFTYFALISLILCGLILSACGTKSKALKVATDATFPPFETVDTTTGKLVGFDIDLINAIAAKENMTIELVNTPFDSMLAGVGSCQYDIAIAGISVNADRKAAMLFSNPYTNAGQIVVVNKSNTTVKSVADLPGLKVAAQLGTTGEIEAKKIANVVYKPYDSYDLAFLDLQNGQVDAVIAVYMTALQFIAKNPDKLTTVGTVFTDESYAIAVCKTKQELVDKLNDGIQKLIDDGTIKALELKWLAAAQ
jgi:polar amino acid transport system substrate-binding protein